MSNYRAAVLQEFDELIAGFQRLVAVMPYHPFDFRGVAYEETPENQAAIFYDLRAQYLKLLTSIPSQDAKLKDVIERVREAYPVQYQVESVLDNARSLRSDYAAGLLSAVTGDSDSTVLARDLLQEAFYETEHFQSPFAEVEIDRLEKLVKRAVRVAFSGESPHFYEVHNIFHPKAGIVVGTSADVPDTEWRDRKWALNREKLLNSLTIMLQDKEIPKSPAPNQIEAKLREDLDAANKKLNRYKIAILLFCSGLIGLAVFVGLRVFIPYSHPNKLALDVTFSLVAFTVLPACFQPAWRKYLFATFGVSLVFIVLQLLAGVP